jgi:hypothetical protein
MKLFCGAALLLTVYGFTSEYPADLFKQKETSHTNLSMQVKVFFDEIGFFSYDKPEEEIKQEYAIWISKKENQTRFLAKISEQLTDETESLLDEIETLQPLEKPFALWTNILESKNKLLSKGYYFFDDQYYLASCLKNGCCCCSQSCSIDEEFKLCNWCWSICCQRATTSGCWKHLFCN